MRTEHVGAALEADTDLTAELFDLIRGAADLHRSTVTLTLVPTTQPFKGSFTPNKREYEMPYYRPPTKLREGNVFSRECLSVQKGWGPHVTTLCDVIG